VWAATPDASAKRSIQPSPDPTARAKVAQSYGQMPLSFEPNRGQTDSQVKYLSRGRGYQIFLTPNETVLSLKEAVSRQRSAFSRRKNKKRNRNAPLAPSTQNPAPDVLRMKLVGANPSPALEGVEKLPGISNYFIGKDATQWRTNIPNYRRVVAKQVYPGVDLVYYGQGRQLEYDFVIAPGASSSSIRFAVDIGNSKSENRQTSTNTESRVASPELIRIDANGDLVISLDSGEVRFRKPSVYQEGSRQPLAVGNRQFIDARYVLLAENRVGFEVGAYDKSLPLVIDPVLSYSTYLGGLEIDGANAIAVSNDGAAFIAGETDSLDFPTAHPLQPNMAAHLIFPTTRLLPKSAPTDPRCSIPLTWAAVSRSAPTASPWTALERPTLLGRQFLRITRQVLARPTRIAGTTAAAIGMPIWLPQTLSPQNSTRKGRRSRIRRSLATLGS